MGRYYTQLVCMNGHQITDKLETLMERKIFALFLDPKLLPVARKCNSPIFGDYEVSCVVSYRIPNTYTILLS